MSKVSRMNPNELERRPGSPMALHRARERVRVTFAGETIVDSTQAMVMDEDGHDLVYYFPEHEIRMDLLVRTPHSSR